MTKTTTSALADLESRLVMGEAFDTADVDRVLACGDLIGVGMLGEAARKAIRGDRVTFGRVLLVAPDEALDAAAAADAGEVRLAGTGTDAAALVARVRDARATAGGRPLTGGTLADLLALAGGDHAALTEICARLRDAGLQAVAEVPLDEFVDRASAIEAVRAAVRGGLGVWRATVTRAPAEDRAALIERAAAVQDATGALRAFAPLPRQDAREEPATGYDDVRTIAAARVRCRAIPSIQVDWSLYGPKLAQVAIAYGADDIDAVPAVDTLQLGRRRSPREDLERQIRSAFAEPVERDGRYEVRG